MFRFLRAVEIINLPIRIILKFAGFLSPKWIGKKILPRWRVSGIINVKLNRNIQFRYYAKCDDHIADILYYNPENYDEYNELILFSALAGRSSFVFDIGANTGLFSIIASISNRNSRVWAFEPYEPNYIRARKNFSLNNCHNISIFQKAIGESQATIEITVPENDRVSDVVSADKNFTELFYRGQIKYKQKKAEQISLDEFISQSSIQQIDLIKIDVENYDLSVLKGAINILKKMNPVILCEMFVDEKRIRFYEDVMKPEGYSCYLISKEGIQKSDTLVDNPVCRNYLFIKASAANQYLSFSDIDRMVSSLIEKPVYI